MKNKARRIIASAITTLFCLSGCINETYDVLEKEKIVYGYKDVNTHSFTPDTFCPTKGEVHALVIPIWYKDSNAFITLDHKESVREDIRKAFFGTNEETGWRSVKTYYEEASYGTLYINGIVAPWYEVNKKTTDMTSYEEMYALAEEACAKYIETRPEEDLSIYDIDNNGAFDAYCIVNAGPLDREEMVFWGYVEREGKDPTVTDRLDVASKMVVSHGFMYNKDNYATKTGIDSEDYYAQNGEDIDAHVFIHEFGHLFGANDYYDYNTDNPDNVSGGFSMQDLNCGTHDPYTDMVYGWVKPYIPTESCTIKLSSYAKTGDFVILKDEWNKDKSPFDEYLILEYFTPDGLNKRDVEKAYRGINMFKSGLRIWHVDSRLMTYELRQIDEYLVQTPTGVLETNPYAGGKYDIAFQRRLYYLYVEDHPEYENYHELQWIRNDLEATSTYKTRADAEDLFYAGDVFDMNKFGKQFPNNGSFDSGESLSWTVKVKKQTRDDVVLELTKAK